ncbi:MAG: GFA family protein [Candidatus Margulisbacteria bacterium]|nr:GFA family protein [Candidatus Margulisiibacteriota bacterium]
MSDKTKKGCCLCGLIKVTISDFSEKVGACHCGMCRKWGGGPFMAINCKNNASFEGKENISIFNSSEWAERGFCNQCGTHLFYRVKNTNQHFIPLGLFENYDKFVFNHQIFIDKKPEIYSFENKTNNMTEKEVFAQFASM